MIKLMRIGVWLTVCLYSLMGCRISEDPSCIHQLQIHQITVLAASEDDSRLLGRVLTRYVDSMGDVGACILLQTDRNSVQIRTGHVQDTINS